MNSRGVVASISAFALKGTGAACALGWNVLLARTAPVEVYGSTVVWVGVTLLLSTLVRGGNDLPVLRAAARGGGRLPPALRTAALASVVCTLVLLPAPGLAGTLLGVSSSLAIVALVAVSIPVHAAAWLSGEALKGAGAPLRAVAVQHVALHAVPLVGFAWTSVATVEEALLWLLAGHGASLFVGMSAALPKSWPRAGAGRWAWSGPLLLLALANSVIMWADVLMLSSLQGASAAATYNVSLRLSAVVGFALLATSAVFTPRFDAGGNRGTLPSIRAPLLLGGALAGCTAAVIWILRTELVGLFGAAYGSATEPLGILLLAYAGHAALGIGGYRLLMMGGDMRLGRASVIAAVVNVVLNLVLIPPFGMIGAAVATAVAIVGMDLLILTWTPRAVRATPVSPPTRDR